MTIFKYFQELTKKIKRNTIFNDKKQVRIYSTRFIVMAQYKCIYCPIPKVSCSSIKQVLLLLNQKVTKDIHSMDNFDYRKNGNLGDEEFVEYFKFGIVRNPWDRIVSCYLDKIVHPSSLHYKLFTEYSWYKPDLSFEEFVKGVLRTPDEYSDEHFRSQHSFLVDRKGQMAVDYIGTFENLETSMSYIYNKLSISPIELPHLNESKVHKKHYSEYYTVKTKKFIAKRYKKDIALFGYSFDVK